VTIRRLSFVLLIVLLLVSAVVLMSYDTETYLLWVVHLTALPAVAYPMVYRKVAWSRGPTGKALMNMAFSVALLYVIAIWGFWQPFGIYWYVYSASVTYLGVAITYQFLVMLRLKQSARRECELEREGALR
jgi:cation transport ATPase